MATTVGRPEVQAFYGALAGQRANKGVFITTSRLPRKSTSYPVKVNVQSASSEAVMSQMMSQNKNATPRSSVLVDVSGRGEWIRTTGPHGPK